MKTLAGGALILAGVLAAVPAAAQPPAYHPPAHGVYGPGQNVVLVPLVEQVYVCGDFYYSLRRYYQTQTDLELIRRQTELLAQMQALYGRPAGAPAIPAAAGPPATEPAPAAAAPVAGGRDGVLARLGPVIQAQCLRCHGGGQGVKGGVDLSDLKKVSRETWLECWKSAHETKSMPKGGTPMPEADARLFRDAALKD